MDDTPDKPELIRHQMEDTRAALSAKIENLEHEVVDSVHGAKQAVSDAAHDAAQVVSETVQSVKEVFDINKQTERHPWVVFGGSIALGYIGGLLLDRLAPVPNAIERPQSEPATHGLWHRNGNGKFPAFSYEPARLEKPAPPEPPAKEPEPDWLHKLSEEFQPEIAKLKGLAVGAALGLVRDLLADSIPEQMKPQFTDVMDQITTKVGGEPIRGPLLNRGDDKCSSTKGDNHEITNTAKMGRPMGTTPGQSQAFMGDFDG
jgi:hypothetical protein